MRMIGQLDGESSAQAFSDYLLVQGIDNQIESEKDGIWSVWVHADDELDRAAQLLTVFRQNPSEAKYLKSGQQARKLKELRDAETDAYNKRYRERKEVFSFGLRFGIGPLTLVLIVVSTIVFLFQYFRLSDTLVNALYISFYDVTGGPAGRLTGLPEIRHGQIWRLVTPVFLHFGFFHIFFNMLCLRDMGTMVEDRHSARYLGVLVLVIAAGSNFAQYVMSGPNFGGMSGVVYGLLGYIWIRGKLDPMSGLFLHPNTVTMMIVWFFLCLSGVMGSVANWVHGAGLLMGMAWGYFSAIYRR